MTSSSSNQLYIAGKRKLCRISMYTCALIVETMIAISPGLFNNMQPTPYHEWHEKFTFFLFFLFECPLTKILATLLWSMQILDLSLNITFIQLSTCHDCFSFAHFNFIFFHLYWFLFDFYLFKSYFIHPISYSFVTNIDSHFDTFVFHFIYLGTPFASLHCRLLSKMSFMTISLSVWKQPT